MKTATYATTIKAQAGPAQNAKLITHPDLPFALRLLRYLPDAQLSEQPLPRSEKSPATRGVGVKLWLGKHASATGPATHNVPAAVIELETVSGSLGAGWSRNSFPSRNRSSSMAAHGN